MSLPWNKAVRLRIGANSVQGSLHPAWSPRRVLVSCQHNTGGGISNGPTPQDTASPTAFDGALMAALSELGSARNGQIKDAQILMADARVHFDVVKGEYAHLGERQLLSIAQACLAEILGDRALGCTVRWTLQKDAQHLVIAAIESRDIERVEQLGREHGIQRMSVQPEFCWHWNQQASNLEQDFAVFASVHEGHMVAALVESGSITAFSCGAIPAPTGVPDGEKPCKNAIDDRVDRLLSSVGEEPSRVRSCLLVAPEGGGIGLDARWHVVGSKTESS